MNTADFLKSWCCVTDCEEPRVPWLSLFQQLVKVTLVCFGRTKACGKLLLLFFVFLFSPSATYLVPCFFANYCIFHIKRLLFFFQKLFWGEKKPFWRWETRYLASWVGKASQRYHHARGEDHSWNNFSHKSEAKSTFIWRRPIIPFLLFFSFPRFM